jgi:hypothetical protein
MREAAEQQDHTNSKSIFGAKNRRMHIVLVNISVTFLPSKGEKNFA